MIPPSSDACGDQQQPVPGRRRVWLRGIVKAAGAHTVLLIGAATILFPFFWMLLTSLRPADEVFSGEFRLWPQTFAAIENYSFALTRAPIPRFILNGVIVTSGILVVQLATAIACAYALAKLEFRGRSLVFALVLFGLVIPIQVPALPLFLGLAQFGLLDTYFALMFPFFVSVFAIFLFRQFFKTFPDEIIAAARLDGFTEFEIITRLVIPSAWPAIAAFSVFSITAHWNDLYWPLIVISSIELAPPPLGMMFFRDTESGVQYGSLMAVAAVITAPLIIVFFVAKRHFIQGVTMTGFK